MWHDLESVCVHASFVILPISCESASSLSLPFILNCYVAYFERGSRWGSTHPICWDVCHLRSATFHGLVQDSQAEKSPFKAKVAIFMTCLSLTDLRSYIMQKPETVSLCAGNIHLTAFHNVFCQVTRFILLRLLLVGNWNHSLYGNNLSFSVRAHPVGQNSFPGFYLMINYIKKLNRNPISNVDNIPPTHMKYLMKTRSWGVEFAHKVPVWDRCSLSQM